VSSRWYNPFVPLRNRVTPLGEVVAHPARGLVYGNRGCLHDASGQIRRRYQVRRWIACRLEFKGRRRSPLVQPGKYTELFFLDEATALAAGHRPCAECRRADYDRFAAWWRDRFGDVGADAVDVRLHEQRVDPAGRGHRLHRAAAEGLPDGAFVLDAGTPRLVLGPRLWAWAPDGYSFPVERRRGSVIVVTPPSLVALLRDGWRSELPLIHPSAT
jgi:hypothetical protein